ncbi:uncharacterized protein BO72DRAFT_226892 [Aspergillus fijiensis CBS 313.89]|uniref:Uncharacterized protein n=1 Tax=Aspergillus fijiensis CBS 313.89 TaxID=1448319 RepID=A0A8G1VUR0_9EURO|nr:uncharacterized protein BO72DRAFT_226892 [Aspergillus fijiensis CBS 313.89]RAK73710.1 hypothetical protein BO72DRAFT_226892 [Aspergillus fijiensis CBS 313.89]
MHVTDHSDLLAEVPYHQGRSKNGHGRTVLGHFGEICTVLITTGIDLLTRITMSAYRDRYMACVFFFHGRWTTICFSLDSQPSWD